MDGKCSERLVRLKEEICVCVQYTYKESGFWSKINSALKVLIFAFWMPSLIEDEEPLPRESFTFKKSEFWGFCHGLLSMSRRLWTFPYIGKVWGKCLLCGPPFLDEHQLYIQRDWYFSLLCSRWLYLVCINSWSSLFFKFVICWLVGWLRALL